MWFAEGHAARIINNRYTKGCQASNDILKQPLAETNYDTYVMFADYR